MAIMINKAVKDVKGGVSLYHVWMYQAYHDLMAKYKRTFLGSLWISGSMVATSLSLSIIFGGIFGLSLQEALPYIMSGMLAFTMAAYVLYEAPEMFMANASIIRNHAYPFTYYAFETTCKAVILFFHNMIVFYISMAFVGGPLLPHWSLIFAVPIVIIFMFSWGMVMAMIAARFRDMRFLLPYVGQLLSVLTPIFWHPTNLKGWKTALVDFNPFYGTVEITRQALMGSVAPSKVWVLAIVSTALGVIVWAFAFTINRRRIPFWI
ncbi:ABC transporter permease [Asticcacaulis sp. DW145]|uniref:ABC transporter permease n=1 Tax=Asticcacaulis sp. DW145 TaxID=3095608 RepID=UPI003093CDC1|nr:ABC transporter permease [Asticcacaulis sp. DW145]